MNHIENDDISIYGNPNIKSMRICKNDNVKRINNIIFGNVLINMNQKEKDILDIAESHDCMYIKISKNKNINKIHDLIFGHMSNYNGRLDKVQSINHDYKDNELLHYIGFYYEYITKNINDAIKYYKLAIEHGNKYSMINLAKIYYNGKYTNKNVDMTIKLYNMIIDYRNICINYYETNKLYDKQIKYAYSHALDSLGYIHFNLGNSTKSRKLFQKGIRCENSNSMYNLARKLPMTESYIDEIVKLYKMAIQCGNSYAMNNLAHLYINGIHMNKDIDEAIRLFELAIKHNNSYAMYSMGKIHLMGDYIKKDVNEAIRLFKLAIEYNNSYALEEMYMLYRTGIYIEPNSDLALMYLVRYCECINTPIDHYFDVKNNDICWKEYLHKHWPNKKLLDGQIITLLLISKNRLKTEHLNWMIKGITKMIIEYLAVYEKHENYD